MMPPPNELGSYERVLRLVRDYLSIVIIIGLSWALYTNNQNYREVVADRDREKQQTIEYLRQNYRLSQEAFLETLKKWNDEKRASQNQP